MDKETGRIEAFSDGVFAIAITLLILDLKVPAPGAGDLADRLLAQWPTYVAYVISFAFVGIMWINHHRLFNHIQRSDNGLLLLNLLLLLGISTVPFPTAVLAQHLGKSGQRSAVIVYSGTYFAIAIFFNLLWRHVVKRNRHLLGKEVDDATVNRITKQYSFGPVLYLICVVLAWISVTASLVLNAVLAVFFALPPTYAVRHKSDSV